MTSLAPAPLAAAIVLLGGCATTGPVGGPGIDPLLARGEQPGWQLTVTPARIVFATDDNSLVVDEPNTGGMVPKNGRLTGQRIQVETRTQPCALTSANYAQTVRVTVDGQVRSGCGGDQSRGLSLGAGTWTVLSVNNRPTPLDRPFTAQFERGRLSLQLGCNRLNAPYALAGRVLSTGTVAKTRMACTDPSFEEAAEKALALPFDVEAIGSEQLVLRNPLGTLNLARTRS
ncbi:META domain-containing protein [Sphingomonas glaciei]|uniref:META domain-containing protein n=1 Tax=Sphingomonas glaciei TaxID=2938948 RepID=A0ABY5MSK9_9SPHN|nr:META domain-containing protein [Sphingomonas glaciei]UUR06929.1 META domain-containing protein [Sphingomonas glaciei]